MKRGRLASVLSALLACTHSTSAPPAAAAPPPASSPSPAPGSGPGVQMIDPRAILFSLPTLNEALPPLDGPAGRAFELNEDDWLQVEFVPAAEHAAKERLRQEISEFAKAHRRSMGFTEVYSRKGPAAPLGSLGLALSGIRKAFAQAPIAALGLSSSGAAARGVRGGFAIQLPGVGVLYGTADADAVTSLGFDLAESQLPDKGKEPLVAFAKANRLELVDWLRQRWLIGP